MQYKKSEALFNEAKRHIPGGVNSPVRAFKAVGMDPIFIEHGKAGHIFDVDGNEFIDYISSWGPHILGHCHPAIIKAIEEALHKGTSFGACLPIEIKMAEKVKSFFPSIEKVRMVNSGTEATMSAVRLARGYTKRNLIVKFDGCYHGHSDGFLVQAGSGVATFSSLQNNGVTKAAVGETLIAEFNNIDSVEILFKKYPQQIAAVILEPIMGNMGVIKPQDHFLESLRQLCTDNETLLIFDEVITGFRFTRGGAQSYYGIVPDLTCLGKIIGGGLPVGAFGGKADIMDQLSPDGAVYQAGTLSGNPLALSAGLAMLEELDKPETYKHLQANAESFSSGIRQILEPYQGKLQYNVAGTLSTIFFSSTPIKNAQDSRQCDTERYAKFFKGLINKGIYLAPSQFEAIFVSGAHTQKDFDKTFEAVEQTIKTIF